jgi:AraC-like DNA-binding protein
MVGNLLTQVFSRVASLVDQPKRAALAANRFSKARPHRNHRAGRRRRCRCSIAEIAATSDVDGQSLGTKLERALRLLDSRYKDETLKLGDVAAEMNVSIGYAARILKQSTGRGFAITCTAGVSRRRGTCKIVEVK